MDKLKTNSKDNIHIKYNNTEISSDLVFRKRKNITIQIKPNYGVIILSPYNVSKKVLKEILIKNGDWVLKKLEEYKRVEHIYKEKEFINNEKFMYLGKEYDLKIIHNKNEEIFIENSNLVVKVKNIEREYVKKKIKLWYKEESDRLILERLVYCRENYDMMMQLIPSKLKVKEQKNRWGTCTSNRAIYINSKISMLRKEAIDYILVHEFSHLVHMNHSKDFYEFVGQIIKNYKEEEKWLKENSYKLKL